MKESTDGFEDGLWEDPALIDPEEKDGLREDPALIDPEEKND